MDLGGCHLDPVRRTFTGPAGEVGLSKSECALLAYLGARPRTPIAKAVLLREVWGYATGVKSRTVDTTVNRLRSKIEVDPSTPALLVTHRGRGVAFSPVAGSANEGPGPQLVGRSTEQAALRDHLAASAPGLLTLVGPPGVGKTSLAGWAAASQRAPVVEARDAVSREELRGGVLRTLGPDARSGPFDAVGLLVLDNLEQLDADACRQVGEWAALGPVLATSQRRLDLQAEDALEIGPLPAEAALALLRARLPSDLALSDEALTQVVSACDGLPLELELLGTAIPRFGVDTLSEVSALHIRAPAGGWDLAQAMDWSWSLLEPSTARVLRWLSVFRGSFDLQAAAAVLEVPPFELLQVLSELHERSLLAGNQGVFRLLGVVRDSALERLNQAGERDAARAGLVRWCSTLWDDYVRRGPDRVQRHHLDILAVLDAVPAEQLGPLVAAWVEGIAVPTGIEVERLVRRARASEGPEAAFLWAACHDAARLAGDRMAAEDARRAVGALALDDRDSVARAYVQRLVTPGERWSAAMTHAWDAAPDHERGYFVQRLPVSARPDRLNELLSTCTARGWTYAAGSVSALLGATAFEAGDAARAIGLLSPEGEPHLAAYRLFYLGMAHLDLGQLTEARAAFAAGRTAAPQAYAARCAALQLTVDLAAGEDVGPELQTDLIDRFHVGPLADLLRALHQPDSPEHAEQLASWRAAPAVLDRSSFLAYAAAWLLLRAREPGTPLPQ